MKEGAEYRLSRHVLEIGVACGLLFGSMGIVSVVAALRNADGSFQNPIGAALAFGIGWSCMTLLSGWLVLASLRHRVFIGNDLVREQGCFSTREFQLASIQRAIWKNRLNGGKLILYEAGGKSIAVEFGNYTFRERLELIRFFRDSLATNAQEGWECFETNCLPEIVDYETLRLKMRGYLRFAAIGFAIALPAMYALLVFAKLLNGSADHRSWISVGIAPLGIAGMFLGGMWFTARLDLAKAK